MKRFENVKEINKYVEDGKNSYLFMISEAYQDRCVVNIINEIEKADKRVVLIAGPSSSGKTSSAKKICLHFDAINIAPLYLGTDDYFIDRANIPLDENGKQNFDSLEALDIELFGNQLDDLLCGKEVSLPTYNFITGMKEYGNRIVKLSENQRIVIEGIHALNDALTPAIDKTEKYKVFVCPKPDFYLSDGSLLIGEDVRKIRRIVRDFNKRGWSVEKTLDMWENVINGEKIYIFPFEDSADYYFNTALPYELCVLKKHIVPLLEKVSKDNAFINEANRLLNIVNQFHSIDDESQIEGDSIIREFIGGSILEGIL